MVTVQEDATASVAPQVDVTVVPAGSAGDGDQATSDAAALPVLVTTIERAVPVNAGFNATLVTESTNAETFAESVVGDGGTEGAGSGRNGGGGNGGGRNDGGGERPVQRASRQDSTPPFANYLHHMTPRLLPSRLSLCFAWRTD